MSDTPEALECRKNGGIWYNDKCMSQEDYNLIVQESKCKLDGGIWENNTCLPSITIFDCTDTVEMSPGQFAIGWGDLPELTKKLNIHYKPEGKPERIYKGIKPTCDIPIIISGQKPGVIINCQVKVVNEWNIQVGYSNEIKIVTKTKD